MSRFRVVSKHKKKHNLWGGVAFWAVYIRTSRKRPPKMSSLGVLLHEVVAYKSFHHIHRKKKDGGCTFYHNALRAKLSPLGI